MIDPLKTSELNNALHPLIKQSQDQFFSTKINALVKGGKVSLGSPIRSLQPFFDENGLLRVGGRLQRDNFSFDEKNFVILHRDC